jgi:hypothetical protein
LRSVGRERRVAEHVTQKAMNTGRQLAVHVGERRLVACGSDAGRGRLGLAPEDRRCDEERPGERKGADTGKDGHALTMAVNDQKLHLKL